MKKLMTMLAAVGMAFGLFAEEPEVSSLGIPESFENMTADAPLAMTDGLWSFADADGGEATVKAYGSDPTYEYDDDQNTRAVPFEMAAQANYLKVQTTFANPLYRTVKEDEEISDNVCIDQLVQFTDGVEDDEPTIAEDAKIAVWLKASTADDTDTPETNLYVTAAFFANGETEYKNYKLADSKVKPGDWCRITVKNIVRAAGDYSGFVVYIDGVAAEVDTEELNYFGDVTLTSDAAIKLADDKQLFLAKNADPITAVGFAGRGNIDDVSFLVGEPPFAIKHTKAVTITWKTGVTAFKVNGEDAVLTEDSYVVEVPVENMEIEISEIVCPDYNVDDPETWTVSDNLLWSSTTGNAYKFEFVEDGDAEIEIGVTAKVYVAYVNNVGYESFAEALAAVDAASRDVPPTPATVNFKADCIQDGMTFPAETVLYVNGTTWEITVPAGKKVVNTVGIEGEKNVTVNGDLDIKGIILSGTPETVLTVTNGTCTILADGLTVGDAAADQSAAFIIGEAGLLNTTAGKITLGANGRVVVPEAVTVEDVFTAAPTGKKIVPTEIKEEETVVAYQYSLVDLPKTGFMVILAGDTEGEVYDTLAAALENAAAGATIKLLAAQTETTHTEIEVANIAIDLNGNALTFDGCDGIYFKTVDGVVSNGTITVLDASANNDWCAIGFEDGNGLIKDVVINSGNCKGGINACSAGEPFNQKTVTCQNVQVTGAGRCFYAETAAMTLDADCASTQVGTLPGHPEYSCALAAGWLGQLTVNGGEYKADANVVGTMSSPADIQLNDGTFTGVLNYIPVTPSYLEQFGRDHVVSKVAAVELTAPTGYFWEKNGDYDVLKLIVATVNTTPYSTAAAALTAVQTLEAAGTYPIAVTACVDDLEVTNPLTSETITLAKGAEIAITAAGWTFTGTVSGEVTLAAGKSIIVPEGSTLTVKAPAGCKVDKDTTTTAGSWIYTVKAIEYATLKVVAGDVNVSDIVVTNAAGTVVAADTQFDIDDAVVVAYKSATFATDYELDESKGTLTVTLNQAGEATITVFSKKTQSTPVIDPTQPSVPMDKDAADAAVDAINTPEGRQAYIKVPEAFETMGTEAQATYKTYFNAKKVESATQPGMFEVVLELNSDGEAALKATLDGADGVKKIKPADIAAGTAQSAQVAAVPGFYYGVKAGNGIGSMEIKNSVPATGTTVTLSLPQFQGSGFYTIVASPTPLQ